MADEEFADIDWSVAINMTQQVGGAEINSGGNKNDVDRSQCNNQNHVAQGNSMPPQPMITAEPPTSSVHQPSVDTIEALRNQILQLNEKITEMEESHYSSESISRHLIKTAEEEAERKVHLVQEELRRVKMEADKYKGSWVRSKKRVAELERNVSSGGGGKSNRVSQDNQQENNVNISAFGFPTDIETRRVTPSNVGNQEDGSNNQCATTMGQQLFEGDTTTVSGSKRKMTEQPSFVDVGLTTSATGLISQTIFQYEIQCKHDTVVQRLARHLLMRDEMGSYSLTQMELSLLDNKNAEVKAAVIHNESAERTNHSMQQSLDKGEETRSYVRSILYQLLDTDGVDSKPSGFVSKSASSSGLFFILLTRLITLFDGTKTRFDENDGMECGNSIARESVPSISVLHLLRVMSDMLLVSAQTRDDLRHWLYQSQQPLGSVNDQKSTAELSTPVSSRIEGLPPNQIKPISKDSKEALWTGSCRASLIEKGNKWEPMTMTKTCDTFFRVLVALMKGSSYGSNSFDLESKAIMTQLIREQAIRLVLMLMADAPPYHTESVGKTPYLWKFWFDSLFLTNSSNHGGSENATDSVEEFFACEVPNGRVSLRKRCGRPMSQETTKSNKQKRSNSGSINSLRRDENVEQVELLSVNVKCRLIQLLTHLVVSSSSVQQAIFQPTGPKLVALARRILAATLDEVDGSIIPLLLSPLSKSQSQTTLSYLELSCSYSDFMLALSTSNEGMNMLRYQMRIVSANDEETNWSQSAISCMALVLNGALSCAIDMEREEITPAWAADLTPYLNRLAEQSVSFFKALQSFAHNQKASSSKSKPPTFASLISEQHVLLLSCFQKLSTRGQTGVPATCLLSISDELKYDVQVMMEEIMYDDV